MLIVLAVSSSCTVKRNSLKSGIIFSRTRVLMPPGRPGFNGLVYAATFALWLMVECTNHLRRGPTNSRSQGRRGLVVKTAWLFPAGCEIPAQRVWSATITLLPVRGRVQPFGARQNFRQVGVRGICPWSPLRPRRAAWWTKAGSTHWPTPRALRR